MREYEHVQAEFAAKIAGIGPKPAKSYIAYNDGAVLRTDDIVAARKFSPKGLIETIDPDPTVVRVWRDKKYDIQAEIDAQWKKELFAEGGLPTAISEKILTYAGNFADSQDDQAEKFISLTYLVDDCIRLANK